MLRGNSWGALDLHGNSTQMHFSYCLTGQFWGVPQSDWVNLTFTQKYSVTHELHLGIASISFKLALYLSLRVLISLIAMPRRLVPWSLIRWNTSPTKSLEKASWPDGDRQVAGDRWQVTGDKWWVTGGRWQVTGDRLGGTGGRWRRWRCGRRSSQVLAAHTSRRIHTALGRQIPSYSEPIFRQKIALSYVIPF